jgi:DNA polymerase-1
VNAIYGWVKTVWYLQDLIKPGQTFVFFDRGKSAARLEVHPEYKANRTPTPEALRKQLLPILEIARAMGIGIFAQENVEADDLLAAYAVRRAKEGLSIAVASADKDFAQIVGGPITQWVPPAPQAHKRDWQPMDPEKIQAKWGVSPQMMVDFLSLVGDSADNIDGVRGVGAKTAAQWLERYGSIDEILAHIDELPFRFRSKIRQGEELLRRNQQLIRFDLSLELPVPELSNGQSEDFYRFLEEYELPALLQIAIGRKKPTAQALFPWD